MHRQSDTLIQQYDCEDMNDDDGDAIHNCYMREEDVCELKTVGLFCAVYIFFN